jgi:hypothetical protein
MRKLEIQRDRQRVHQQILLRKLTALNSPNELEAQALKMNLDLAPTPADRIVHLSTGASDAVRRNELLLAERIGTAPTHP